MSVLLAAGANPSALSVRTCTPALCAALGRYWDILQLIMDANGDVSVPDLESGTTVLHEAAAAGCAGVCLSVLERGGKITQVC